MIFKSPERQKEGERISESCRLKPVPLLVSLGKRSTERWREAPETLFHIAIDFSLTSMPGMQVNFSHLVSEYTGHSEPLRVVWISEKPAFFFA